MQSDLVAAVAMGLSALGVPPQTVSVVEPGSSPVAIERLAAGSGPYAQLGDRVTVHFVVRTLEGKELANSLKRGMPFTVRLEEMNPFWLAAVEGLQPGGRTRMRSNSSLFFGRAGALPIVPPETTIVAELTLLKVQKPAPVKAGQR